MKIKIKVLKENNDNYVIGCGEKNFIISNNYIENNKNIEKSLLYFSLKYINNYDELPSISDYDYESEIEEILLFESDSVLNLRMEEILL